MANEKSEPDRTEQLEDALKGAERRVAEMRAERDKAYELVEEMKENIEESNALTVSWIEAFDMQLGDDGNYHWVDNIVQQYDGLRAKHIELVMRWNRFVPKYNAVVNPKPIGRPLAASDAQCAQVLKLHKAKVSLRDIVDETSLSMRTVRTIIERENRTDRTTINRLQKVDPDHAAVAAWKARKRVRDALPKRINKMLDNSASLLKAAKGLGD